MTHFFLSLSASQVLGLVFFGSIIFACVLGMIINWATHFFGTIHRAKILARIDEFEWNEDPYAKLCYSFNVMTDNIYTKQAIDLLNARLDGAPQISPTNCTCFKCNDQQHCPFAFDSYNMDGDCLMTK